MNIKKQGEVAVMTNYTFDCQNFYVEGDEYFIFGYDENGVETVKYFINRDAFNIGNETTYMKKFGAEYYYIPETVIDNPEYENCRQELYNTGKLLCHTIKPDGRMCFYVMPNIELEYSVPNIWK